MSPTIFQFRKFRFFFFSREEPRMHVHVRTPDGEAKFWLEPPRRTRCELRDSPARVENDRKED